MAVTSLSLTLKAVLAWLCLQQHCLKLPVKNIFSLWLATTYNSSVCYFLQTVEFKGLLLTEPQ